MVIVRAILLRSPAGLGGLLIALLGTALALSNHTAGFNLWPDRVNGLTNASVLMGVIAAGVSSIEANRWQHFQRVKLKTAFRPRLVARASHAVAVVLPSVVGFWIAVTIVSVQATFSGAYGAPSWLWLTSLGFGVAFAGTLGYAVGSLLPHKWFVGPGTGILFYALYVVLLVSGLPYGIVSLFPASSNYDSIFTVKITSTLLGQSVFFVAASALTLLLIGFRRRRTPLALVSLGLVGLVLVASSGVVIARHGQVTTGHNPGDFTCVGQTPVVCLNTGYATAGEALHAEFERLTDLTEGTPLAPERLEQNVQGIGDEPAPDSRSLYLEQWAARDDLTFSVFRYVKEYGGAMQCMSSDGGYLEAQVDSWLADFYESTAGSDDNAVSRRLAALTSEEGAHWFKSNYDAYASCSLTMDDLP